MYWIEPHVSFPKIPRLNREIVITEKIDGENTGIYIEPGRAQDCQKGFVAGVQPPNSPFLKIAAQSRNQYLSLDNDLHGFAAWVAKNANELAALGPGRHFGEWWGSGVKKRNYGLTNGEKRFSLFNTGRWHAPDQPIKGSDNAVLCPPCCDVVPVLYRGTFDSIQIEKTLKSLALEGSWAVRGYMKPEGIIVFHTAANAMFKVTLDGDRPKGE